MAPDPTADMVAAPAPERALDALVAEFGSSIYRVARSIVRDSGLAEDVVQETLVKVWMHLPEYRGDAPLKNWVLRIAHNTAISMLRKRRDETLDPTILAEVAAPTGTGDAERRLHGQMAVDDLWVALATLDETTRSIVVLREVEGLTYEEISQLLDLPLPTIKTRLFRARRALAEKMEAWR